MFKKRFRPLFGWKIHLIMISLLALLYFIGDGAEQRKNAEAQKVPTQAEQMIMNRLVALDFQTLQAKVNTGGRPTLVFFYASWCPFCEKQFARMPELLQTAPDLQVMYVSLDDDAVPLARFLNGRFLTEKKTDKQQDFIPYHAPAGAVRTDLFQQMEARYHVAPQGSIPYLLLFAGNGKPVMAFSGLTQNTELQRAITRANAISNALRRSSLNKL